MKLAVSVGGLRFSWRLLNRFTYSLSAATWLAFDVSKRRVQPAARPGAARNGAPTIVSAKPSPEEIDYRRTPEADQWKGIYTLKNGSRVKWVRPA
ncbi:MAG: hypothetical protein ACP5E5_11515 [Acidobacteriaceae bacterium]